MHSISINTVLMAATRTSTQSPNPAAARQLGELLKQQQEPFVLEIYLSERGCLRKKLTSESAKYNKSIGCHGSSCGKFLKMNKKGLPNFPKVLRLVICNKLFAFKGLKTKNSDDVNGKVSVSEMKRNDPETAEPDRFSTASSTTLYNSCTDSDMDEPSTIKKAVADSKFQWSSIEDSKERSPARKKSLFLSRLLMEDSILSTSLWNLLLLATPDRPSCVRESQEADGSNPSTFSIPKRVLQQAKKLREECLGSEVVYERIKDLGKRYGDELSKTVKLLEVDVMSSSSTQEWNDHEHQKKDVGVVLGNAIAEEIITEVVMDMIFMFHS
ncbi:hypothetical protein V6N13_049163 [Hibiscus sabdariffa]|uniref:DUF4378 domain-containing protein n=1 Tax=Hibiscus sabdariffa TaxID=183260 RepID=A0ABR2QYN7_9ROSI